jgi:hypothetical protein
VAEDSAGARASLHGNLRLDRARRANAFCSLPDRFGIGRDETAGNLDAQAFEQYFRLVFLNSEQSQYPLVYNDFKT